MASPNIGNTEAKPNDPVIFDDQYKKTLFEVIKKKELDNIKRLFEMKNITSTNLLRLVDENGNNVLHAAVNAISSVANAQNFLNQFLNLPEIDFPALNQQKNEMECTPEGCIGLEDSRAGVVAAIKVEFEAKRAAVAGKATIVQPQTQVNATLLASTASLSSSALVSSSSVGSLTNSAAPVSSAFASSSTSSALSLASVPASLPNSSSVSLSTNTDESKSAQSAVIKFKPEEINDLFQAIAIQKWSYIENFFKDKIKQLPQMLDAKEDNMLHAAIRTIKSSAPNQLKFFRDFRQLLGKNWEMLKAEKNKDGLKPDELVIQLFSGRPFLMDEINKILSSPIVTAASVKDSHKNNPVIVKEEFSESILADHLVDLASDTNVSPDALAAEARANIDHPYVRAVAESIYTGQNANSGAASASNNKNDAEKDSLINKIESMLLNKETDDLNKLLEEKKIDELATVSGEPFGNTLLHRAAERQMRSQTRDLLDALIAHPKFSFHIAKEQLNNRGESPLAYAKNISYGPTSTYPKEHHINSAFYEAERIYNQLDRIFQSYGLRIPNPFVVKEEENDDDFQKALTLSMESKPAPTVIASSSALGVPKYNTGSISSPVIPTQTSPAQSSISKILPDQKNPVNEAKNKDITKIKDQIKKNTTPDGTIKALSEAVVKKHGDCSFDSTSTKPLAELKEEEKSPLQMLIESGKNALIETFLTSCKEGNIDLPVSKESKENAKRWWLSFQDIKNCYEYARDNKPKDSAQTFLEKMEESAKIRFEKVYNLAKQKLSPQNPASSNSVSETSLGKPVSISAAVVAKSMPIFQGLSMIAGDEKFNNHVTLYKKCPQQEAEGLVNLGDFMSKFYQYLNADNLVDAYGIWKEHSKELIELESCFPGNDSIIPTL